MRLRRRIVDIVYKEYTNIKKQTENLFSEKERIALIFGRRVLYKLRVADLKIKI